MTDTKQTPQKPEPETKAQKPAKKQARVAGRKSMTAAEAKRLGLDPAPYGKLKD